MHAGKPPSVCAHIHVRTNSVKRLPECCEQVFYAPHIASLSSTLGTKFQPIRYILESGSIASNVFYSSSIIQVQTLWCGLALTSPARGFIVIGRGCTEHVSFA